MRTFKVIVYTIALTSLASCGFSKKETNTEAIARVGDNYLYQSDILDLVPENTSKEDSITIVKAYIERWATQKLLTEVSEINIDLQEKKELEGLVNQYKYDLYTKAYLEQLVQKSIDTVVTQEEVKQYYQDNKTNFRTNIKLAKLRYIQVPDEHQKFKEIKDKFFNPKKSDSQFWDTYKVQLNSVALNDSVWVDLNQIYQKIPFVNPENEEQYIQSGKTFEYKGDNTVYFVKVNSVLQENEVSPFEYIEPTIRQVILNRRKLEFIKKIEKEIIIDAYKNKKYEIYK